MRSTMVMTQNSVHVRPFLRSRIVGSTVLLVLLCLLIDALHIQSIIQIKAPSTGTHPQSHIRHVPQRIFIASLQWKTEAILRSHWNQAILNLSDVLGPSNVYFSAYASESPDDTRGALKELHIALGGRGVGRTIVYDTRNHSQVIEQAEPGDGLVEVKKGERQLRRIPYLAHLRNLSFQPLYELAARGERFDKILFLNDVVFQPSDVLRLLNTNNGDYAAACSLDFANAPDMYDTFALFDSEFNQYWTRTWPYFRSKASRQAMMRNEPVPVKSCWNGMVIFDTSPFYSSTNPLHFRALPTTLAQSHIEASECCLIHADNPLSVLTGIFVNPDVRVGYTAEAYEAMQRPLSFAAAYKGVWHNRIRRWFTGAVSKKWVVEPRVRAWEGRGGRNVGSWCAVDEMQVLTGEGWRHV